MRRPQTKHSDPSTAIGAVFAEVYGSVDTGTALVPVRRPVAARQAKPSKPIPLNLTGNCAHLGDKTGGQRLCKTCQGEVLKAVYACGHPAHKDTVLPECGACLDNTVRLAQRAARDAEKAAQRQRQEQQRRLPPKIVHATVTDTPSAAPLGLVDLATFFDRIVVINLKRRPDRREAFEAMLARVGWPFKMPERFEAVDGSKIPKLPRGWTAGAGAWGVRQSMLRIIEQAIMDDVQHLLILEDDAVCVEGFLEKVKAFLAIVPGDYDGLCLGGSFQNKDDQPFSHDWNPRIAPGLRRVHKIARLQAFSARPKYLAALYELWGRVDGKTWERRGKAGGPHIDWLMEEVMPQHKIYAPDPWLIGQEEGWSDIAGKEEPRRFIIPHEIPKPVREQLPQPSLPVEPRSFPLRFDEKNLFPERPDMRFNPSIIRYEDGYLMAWRDGGWGPSEICVGILDDTFQPVRAEKLDLSHPLASLGKEDPRLFWFDGKLYVSFIGTVPGLRTVSQLYARIDNNLKVEQVFAPKYVKQRRWEKNWMFFEHAGQLYAEYTILPHRILRIDGDAAELVHETTFEHAWPYGEARGGTPPIRVGDEMWSFFHSSIDINGFKTYHVGLYTFSPEPPFQVLRMSKTPVDVADKGTTPNGSWCAVVFPCGAVRVGDKWVLSAGIHDRWIELREYEHAQLEEALQ